MLDIVPRLRRSQLWVSYPDLTVGPISCRPFGPDAYYTHRIVPTAILYLGIQARSAESE
jgi:hypothetical protein